MLWVIYFECIVLFYRYIGDRMKKIITRIFGGIGNQLFCYAAARRLALKNNAELVIDDISGFVRDFEYKRHYQLDHFRIPCHKATAAERLEPLSRVRRYLKRAYNRRQPFEERKYIQQVGRDFDHRLLQVRSRGTLYLEGYWQSEDYFKDVEQIIRQDLQIIPPEDALNKRMADEIQASCAVALHMRWFENPGCVGATFNASVNYYLKAIEFIEQKVKAPHYFLFSDNPDSAQVKLSMLGRHVTMVYLNKGDENAYADLWLMTKCKHFITADSTFSWWGGWLGEGEEKIVVTPNLALGSQASWGFKGLIPNGWVKL